MKVVVFSSGSSGNSTLISFQNFNILIDCGITKKEIDDNLAKLNLSINDISALFITHEHIDHIKSLSSFLRIEHLRIYMSHGTYEGCIKYFTKAKKFTSIERLNEKLNDGGLELFVRLDNSMFYSDLLINNVYVSVIPLFHDSLECVGFSFKELDKKLVYIADTGYVHQELYPMISNANCYILESNHDPEILMHSSRPYPLKIRILSNNGHLSNVDSMVTLAHIIGPNTSLVMHAHISQECNLSEIVNITRRKVFEEYMIDVENIEFVILTTTISKEYDV